MNSILLVDRETLFREAVRHLINSSWHDFQVVGEAVNYESALTEADRLKPSIVCLDLELEGPSGLELLYELRRRENPSRKLILSRSCSTKLVPAAIAAGASGCVLKDEKSESLRSGLTSISEGRTYFCPTLTHLEGVSAENVPPSSSNDPLALLSARERQIFHLLAAGLQNSVIAKKLFISPRTVETHRARIVRKLGLASNAELIRYAIRHGLTAV